MEEEVACWVRIVLQYSVLVRAVDLRLRGTRRRMMRFYNGVKISNIVIVLECVVGLAFHLPYCN